MSAQIYRALENVMPFDIDNPGTIARTMAEIENSLHEDMNRHAELAGKIKRAEKFFKTYEATLYEMIDPASCSGPAERQKFALADMHSSEEWIEHLLDVQEYAKLSKRFDYQDVRRSIGQTLVKLEEHSHGRFGEAGQPAS
jgi:hypothetical protein